MTIEEFSFKLTQAKAPLKIHLIGVAGSGMSGLARLLIEMGHVVSGSDRVSSGEIERLRAKGLIFSTPHCADAVHQVDAVIYSSAIRSSNVALAEALALGISTFRRAECLAAILHTKAGVIVAGTHGKTTTSSMIAHILRTGGFEPCHYVGAEIPVLGSNAQWSQQGELMVAEGDESDGTLALYHPRHALILNIEEEHLDHYTNGIEGIRQVFSTLLQQTSGEVVYCGECEEAALLCKELENTISYAWQDADWTATHLTEQIGTVSFDVSFRGNKIGRVELGIPGRHNVLNALGAIAMTSLCGADFQKIAHALSSFAGAKRRFETKHLSSRYRVVDDYGHHPTEISATLQTARSFGPKRLIVLFQPHRFSRTQKLADDFGKALQQADLVFVAPIYAASEDPIDGVSGQTIVDAVHAHGDTPALLIDDLAKAHHVVGNVIEAGDLILTLGAGNVHEAGNKLIHDLKVIEELDSECGGISMKLYEPMSRHTTIRVGGPAQYWIEPEDFEQFRKSVRFFKARGIPVRIVGRGSNLLIRDGGIRGAVIHPKGGRFGEVKVHGKMITAGVGARFKKLSSVARDHHLEGFEWMEGIPGNVGGGLRMNAGAMGVETFDQVVSVTFLDEDGEVRTRNREEIESFYRNVPELNQNYALEATFSGSKGEIEDIQKRLDESRHHRITTQPKAASAGCIFKNPSSVGAGKLIDEMGLKTTSTGKAEVSPEHGNFIVNRGGASAEDVLALIEQIKEQALKTREITLETEVQILGEDDSLF